MKSAASLKKSIKLTNLKPLTGDKKKNERQYKLSVSGMEVGISPQSQLWWDIKTIKKEYYKQLYSHKFDSLHEIDQVFEKYK